MAIVQETRCDMCGEVLVGWRGRVQISRSYMEFQGFMRDWKANPGSTWRDQTYISSPDKRQMAFCTETPEGEMRNCFWDYIDMKRESNRVRREAQLREEAQTDWEIRNGATGPRRGPPPPASPPGSY